MSDTSDTEFATKLENYDSDEEPIGLILRDQPPLINSGSDNSDNSSEEEEEIVPDCINDYPIYYHRGTGSIKESLPVIYITFMLMMIGIATILIYTSMNDIPKDDFNKIIGLIFLSIFSWEHISRLQEIKYKPSYFLYSFYRELTWMFNKMGHYLATMSNFLSWFKVNYLLNSFLTTMSCLASPLIKISFSWWYFFGGYMDSIVKYYRNPVYILAGTTILISTGIWYIYYSSISIISNISSQSESAPIFGPENILYSVQETIQEVIKVPEIVQIQEVIQQEVIQVYKEIKEVVQSQEAVQESIYTIGTNVFNNAWNFLVSD